MNLKKLNEINETSAPLFFLVISALTLGIRLGFLAENLKKCGSVILAEPILVSDNILLTIANLITLLIPVIIFLTAFAQKNVLLITAYFFVATGFILKPSIINKLGYKSLYAVEIIAWFIALMLLVKYIADKIDFYRSAALSKQDENSN
jgi:hypothetical protein